MSDICATCGDEIHWQEPQPLGMGYWVDEEGEARCPAHDGEHAPERETND